jgi:hypothetical protein
MAERATLAAVTDTVAPIEGTAEAPAKVSGTLLLLGAAGIGALVSISLGVYAREHDAAGQALFTLGFSSTLSMKAWLTTIAFALAIVQVLLALWMYGKLGRAPDWVGSAHRLVGLAAFVVVLPVAYHCLWSLGLEDDPDHPRRFVHSLLGCVFFGAFTTKVLAVRSHRMPGWALPVVGGLVFAVLTGLWLTSSLWYFQNAGFPSF